MQRDTEFRILRRRVDTLSGAVATISGGSQGPAGTAATVTVGTTTTGAAGTSASVTNSGTTSAAVFNFTIPQGAAGSNGTNGTNGSNGISPTLSVASTVATVPSGTAGSASLSGTSSGPVLNLTLPAGPAGSNGSNGSNGSAATVTVGTTTTGAAGTSASVTNSGTASAAVFNFTIPQGAAGSNGTNGTNGSNGISPTLSVASTVATVPSGTAGSASLSGTSSNPVLNLTLPAGPAGTNGTNGSNGSAATVTVGTTTTGSTPAVSNSGTSSAAVLNFTLPGSSSVDLSSPGPIGNTTPSTGKFTNVSLTGSLSGTATGTVLTDGVDTLGGYGANTTTIAASAAVYLRGPLYAPTTSDSTTGTAVMTRTLTDTVIASKYLTVAISADTQVGGTNPTAFATSALAIALSVGTWRIDYQVLTLCSSTTAGSKVQSAMTSGAATEIQGHYQFSTAAVTTAVDSVAVNCGPIARKGLYLGTASLSAFGGSSRCVGKSIISVTTAGTLAFQMAVNASSAGSTVKVGAGSYIIATKVA